MLQSPIFGIFLPYEALIHKICVLDGRRRQGWLCGQGERLPKTSTSYKHTDSPPDLLTKDDQCIAHSLALWWSLPPLRAGQLKMAEGEG